VKISNKKMHCVLVVKASVFELLFICCDVSLQCCHFMLRYVSILANVKSCLVVVVCCTY